jgi:hypothetical protein
VHEDPKCLDLFARELGSVGISFAPGTTGIYGGRPKPIPQIRLFTLFVDKSLLAEPLVRVGEDQIRVPIPPGVKWVPPSIKAVPAEAPAAEAPAEDECADDERADRVTVPLIRLALARSGDKGDSANIAIIARDPRYVGVLRREVTVERMADHFRHLVGGPIQRFEAPGLHAFNFLLQNALGGGGMASLRIDPQGKAYAPMALEMMIEIPRALLERSEAS